MCILVCTCALLAGFQVLPTEICNNAIDDDGDGAIDLQDRDCACEILELTSLIPNPSFEEMTCCPSDRSQLNCAQTWIQASGPTTDYIHQCGWMGWDNFPPPEPFPDGQGIIGFRDGRRRNNGDEQEYNWKEYTGACLSSPLLANTAYRFEFEVGFSDRQSSPPINITFFGTTDCKNLPFGQNNEMLGCPINGPEWSTLGSKRVSSSNGNQWIKTTIEITPTEDIYAIAIGPPCAQTSNTSSTYYFFDNLVLADLESFEFRITETDHPCSASVTLQIPEVVTIQYQWYKDEIALVGETSNELSKIYGEGQYQVRITDQTGCEITEAYDFKIPEIFDQTDIIICNQETYNYGIQKLESSGIYEQVFKSVDNCDSSVILNLTVLDEILHPVRAKIFEGETYEGIDNYTFRNEGNYTPKLITDMGCDSTILLKLEYYNVYFPNVFSPNNDGRNDHFNISGTADLKEIKDLTIYDRWGTEVYSNTDELASESPGWNGRKHGQVVKPGIYTYVTTLLMDDEEERIFVGDVLLIN